MTFFLGRFLVLPKNVSQCCKCLLVANSLAYFSVAALTKKKSLSDWQQVERTDLIKFHLNSIKEADWCQSYKTFFIRQ